MLSRGRAHTPCTRLSTTEFTLSSLVVQVEPGSCGRGGSGEAAPVSCGDEGRWHARSAAFRARPRGASASDAGRQRLSKHNRSPAASLSADVWGEVALTADRLAVPSPTRANADAFRARRPSLAQREEVFRAGFLSRDMGTVKTSLKF